MRKIPQQARKFRQGRRLWALSLLVALFLTAATGLVSCRVGGPSDEEIRQVFREKLPPAKELLSIIYGEGIPLEDDSDVDESWTTPHYYRVAPDFPYQTIASLKTAAESVFSEDYRQVLYGYAFEGTDDYMSRFSEDGGVLTMDVVRKPMGLLAEVYPDTAKVLSGSRYACKVEVECQTATGERRTETVSLSRAPSGEWLFDSAVY